LECPGGTSSTLATTWNPSIATYGLTYQKLHDPL
jgi:hypothetical protein